MRISVFLLVVFCLWPAGLWAGPPLFKGFSYGDSVAEISAKKVPLFACPQIAPGHYCAKKKLVWMGQEMDLSFSTHEGKITEVALMYVQDQPVEQAYKRDLNLHQALLIDYGLVWMGRDGGAEFDLMAALQTSPETLQPDMSRFLQGSYETSPAFLRIWVLQEALFDLPIDLGQTARLLELLPQGTSVVRQQWIRDGAKASGLLVFTAHGMNTPN